MRYTFNALSDRDLEELTRDLLSKELNIYFQSFKPGKDGGVDLRYAGNNEYDEIIVQVKHYIGSTFSTLQSNIQKKELAKIKAIMPKRYILVTSMPLSFANKEALINLLSPFIQSTTDILGQDDINHLLTKYKEVEDAHFKLWLPSTTVLERIVKNGVKGRSTFNKDRIKQKIKLFVINRSHEQAVEKLNKNNFLLITGAPGIGKSTLADILTYQLLEQEYELIFTSDIREAETSFLPGKKQVFYMDDFLGSITLELKTSHNLDSAISAFLQRIMGDKDKRLILTCRTAVFNQAKEVSEKISNSKINISQHEVELGSYSDYHKARILYNHIYWSKFPDEIKLCFIQDKFYRKIIYHPNYNPRIIEFFTDADMISQDHRFKESVLYFLNHPNRLWKHAFNKQISNEGRLLIITLFSFGKSTVNIEHLKSAFEARIQYEITKYQAKKIPNLFNKTIRELDGAYIQSIQRITQYRTYTEFSITNPSLLDYLVDYFNQEDLEEYFDTLESAIYTDQFQERISTNIGMKKRIVFDNKNKARLQELINRKIGNLKSSWGDTYWQEMIILINLFDWKSIKDFVLTRCNDFNKSNIGWSDCTEIINLLEYLTKNDLLNQHEPLAEKYLNILLNNLHSHWQLEELRILLRSNDVLRRIAVNLVHASDESYENISSKVDAAWDECLPNYLEQFGNLTYMELQEDIKLRFQQALEEARELNKLLEIPSSNIFKLKNNILKVFMKKSQMRQKIQADKIFSISDKKDESPEAIDLLFNTWSDATVPY